MRRSLLLALVAGCGARPAAPTTPTAPSPAPSASGEQPAGGEPRAIELEPLRVEVVTNPSGQREVVVSDARDLFDRGNDALASGRYDEALQLYDELLADFSESVLAVPALYNAGLAHEGKGEWDAAIDRYRALVARAPADRDAIDAQVRMGAVLADRQRWTEAGAAFEALLDRNDLTPDDRIEGLARLGYALLETKDYAGAEEILRSGLGYYEEIKATTRLETDYYVAMCQFYLGEIPHRQFAAVPIRLPDKQIERDMDAKSDLVILAHDRYERTLEIGNPYWATAAGYQLAAMRREFWEALVVAPVPPQLEPLAAKVYVEEVHKLARRLLEQALSWHEKNTAMAERAGVSTPWSEASRREAAAISDILARESRGELVTPSTVSVPVAPAPGPIGGIGPGPDYVPHRVEL